MGLKFPCKNKTTKVVKKTIRKTILMVLGIKGLSKGDTKDKKE